MRAFCLFIAVLFLTAAPYRAPAQTNPAPEPASLQSNVRSLEELLKSLLSKEREIARIQEQLQAAPDEVTRAELLEKLKRLKDEQREIADQFERFAVAVDTSYFAEKPKQKFDWQQEVSGLVQPILTELKSATAESRAIAELRSQIDAQEKLHQVASEGAANVEQLLAASPSPALQARLEEELHEWQQRRDDAKHQATALRLQLENKLAGRKSIVDETRHYAQRFFRTRGMNLMLGVAAFCAIFFGIRMVSYLSRKLRPSGKAATFTTRLGSLIFHLLSVLGGLLAALFVFNMAGDWFLLGIIIIFLIGVGWAGIRTLPQYVEMVKLILNVGAVKENERIVFDGIPWKVDSLALSARLVNPLLAGGRVVLPVKYLVGLHSRPPGEKEEWFPCREGDWVELSDGRTGRVAYQTPSTVQLVELGGSQVVYQTPAFLGLNPRTLSTNFRITVTFGVDFKHQAIATTEIPRKLQARVESGLGDVVAPKLIKNVSVEFSGASASSLDYEILVDVDGDAASKQTILRRAISRLAVDACNEHGWVIPFTQITVHQSL